MKAKSLLLLLSLAPMAFWACGDDNEDLGAPSVEVSASTLSFEKANSSQTIQLTATRDWTTKNIPEWINVDPKSGSGSAKAVDVIISVLDNDGLDRSATLTFDIGFDSRTVTVNQAGTGSASDLIVYHNDFDKEEATKTYGTSSSSWPYLDQFEGWKNATGSGVGAEEYTYKAMSVRANSTSSGNYSDYSGSGSNNLFFGSSAYFAVTGIALGSDVNYTLSFGSEKYSQDNGSLFTKSEFHVYVSNDGKKWVELEYSFANGEKEGRWDVATSTFTVPSGTSKLGVYVKTDVASSYRLDDLDLSVATAAGTAIDFSKGVELDGSSSGGDTGTDDYSNAEAKTVAEFISAANTSTYYKLTGKVSNFNSQYCSFDLTDDSGTIYVYSVSNKSDWSSKISNGGTVTLAGKYTKYNNTKDEVINAYILSFEADASAGTEMTIAEALAADAGTKVIVSGTVAATYKRGFVITDGTDYLLIYDGSTCAAAVKDNVKVTGTTASYAGLIQVGNPTVTVVSSGNTLNLPAAKDITSTFDSYSSSKIEYITYTGTLAVSGNYYNVTVSGASTYTGSLSYVNDSFNASSFNGVEVKVTGFYVGLSNSKYINTMVTELASTGSSYLNLSTTSLVASATETSAKFNLYTNTNWTVTSDNAAYTVSPASGSSSSEVTISFAANTSETANTVTFTVAADGVASKTVTLTHKGVSTASGDEASFTISETVSSWAAATDDTYGAGYALTKDGATYGYYKYASTSDAIAPSSDHIRVYKSSVLVIVPPTGKKVAKVELGCVSGKASNMTVLSDNSTATASGTTITWEGSTEKFVAQASTAQVRIQTITVTFN